MKLARELKKIAVEITQTSKKSQEASFSVGGFYRDGRPFGREFYDEAEARDYFEAAQSWAASVALFEQGEEADSWMA